MKVRAIANGNVIDLPEGHGLITAGIYVPVEEVAAKAAPVAATASPEPAAAEAEPVFTASPKLDEAVERKSRSTKVAPMGTKSMQSPASKRSTPKRRK